MSNILPESRYAKNIAFVVQQTGETYWSQRQPVVLAEQPDDRWVKPGPNEPVYKLSYRVYAPALGDIAARIWWVICDLNGIVNPFKPLDPNVPLRCPSADRLVLEVFA